MEAGSLIAPDGRRSALKRPSGARLPDVILQWGVTLLSVAILLLIAYFFLKLIDESTTVFDRFGVFGFTSTTTGTYPSRSSAPSRWWWGR